ncbi:hypothetical protein [Actinoplanes auranticolor]|uniref:Uncharacterized protein n=1 Tax=Actinoplanes auranticolor TaxID=47988 RepID=A0A919VUK8_9ACTN|nr:hypothetical protein [Actinoplanes auranticolor]GIM79524.1 hypothetical protein Aau02nite_86210 [Actinoplanes auranticolor]
MTYDLLLAGDLDVTRLSAALAGLASVTADAVDVAPAEAEAEDRDWDAAVLCTYRALQGDVPWSLDVYFAVPEPPDVGEVSGSLAASLELPVLYPAEPYPPSAYWMALPDGTRTRARVYEQDGAAVVIDAVGKPVPWLPGVRVEAQPEVIREHRMPTPVTDGFEARLAAEMMIPAPEEELRAACGRLAAWEALTVRMKSGWPPDGWYPAEYFQQDLTDRDDLTTDVDRIPAAVRSRFTEALARVDDAFRAATREQPAASDGRGWWWSRVPDPVPWPSPT